MYTHGYLEEYKQDTRGYTQAVEGDQSREGHRNLQYSLHQAGADTRVGYNLAGFTNSRSGGAKKGRAQEVLKRRLSTGLYLSGARCYYTLYLHIKQITNPAACTS